MGVCCGTHLAAKVYTTIQLAERSLVLGWGFRRMRHVPHRPAVLLRLIPSPLLQDEGGFTIVASFGDQFSDLSGIAPAAASFKMPNPVRTSWTPHKNLPTAWSHKGRPSSSASLCLHFNGNVPFDSGRLLLHTILAATLSMGGARACCAMPCQYAPAGTHVPVVLLCCTGVLYHLSPHPLAGRCKSAQQQQKDL